MVRWSVDYNAELTDNVPGVAQADALGSGTGTFLASTGYRVGWTDSITATVWTDDAAGTAIRGNYPIGDLRVLPLKVDPAGTPTVTGSTANFGVMTNNGTVAAWNATNARNAVDDIPPIAAGVGTRDAAVAILAHATDTANFPMETRDLAANEVNVRGVKAHRWLWAASATATTIRIFVNDGTDTYHVRGGEPDGQQHDAGLVRLGAGVGDYSAVVDAGEGGSLEFRFGSNDANPDIGCDAFLLELAVVKAIPESLFGESGADIYVEAHRDAGTYALIGATVTNNSGASVELAWEVSGTPASSGSITTGTSNQYVPMSPDGTIETVGRVELKPA